MTISKWRRFWKSDIIETENWLKQMHQNGYALESVNFKCGKFVFIKAEPEAYNYRIGNKQGSLSVPKEYLGEDNYSEVCSGKDYYIIRTNNDNPVASPSYDAFLEKNVKRKFIVGMFVFGDLLVAFPLAILWVVSFVFFLFGDFELGGFILMSVFGALLSVPIVLLILYFKKLGDINKKLVAKCGKPLNLSWTIPEDTILSKVETQILKSEKRYIKKLKLAWFYSPDKTEKWLETMAEKGFRLLRLDRAGVGVFHFIKGEPQKVKYHIDYQNRTTPAYYDLNKECGWKLFFTSPMRIQSFTVWAKDYDSEIPEFYSDKQSLLKHAKRLALTYSLSFLPISAMYLALLIWNIRITLENGAFFNPMLVLAPIIIFEFGFFAIKTICYYFRIRKCINNENARNN